MYCMPYDAVNIGLVYVNTVYPDVPSTFFHFYQSFHIYVYYMYIVIICARKSLLMLSQFGLEISTATAEVEWRLGFV